MYCMQFTSEIGRDDIQGIHTTVTDLYLCITHCITEPERYWHKLSDKSNLQKIASSDI